jgi:hypothetical protein
MSLLDRAVKAAATAKNQLDEVREIRAQTSVKPIESAGLDEHEQRVAARARALGAPDPFVLLTGAEAADAAGQQLGGPHLTYGDDFTGVKFEAAGSGGRHWRVAVSAFHAIDEAGFDAAEHWRTYIADAVADDGTPVEGLGDAAIRREGEVFVLAHPLLLMIEVSTPEDGDGERATRLARAVVQRLT